MAFMKERVFLVATLVLAAVLSTVGAECALAHQLPGVPRMTPPKLYVIDGYLDRAPENATVVDRVQIYAAGKPKRWLLVTSYEAPGAVMPGGYLSWVLQQQGYTVSGKPEDVDRLLRAPAGAEIKVKFAVYAPAYPLLVIATLDQPAAAGEDRE